MNGILVVDKPAGFTSFDVVAKLRGICSTRRIGHGGTLDPMATGVLPVFIGVAAKAVDLQPAQDKTYEAVLQFGILTDTGDITGEVLERAEPDVGEQDLQQILPHFLGKQQQLPPMYSAVKINGKPLYKYAREGKTVERKLREITIFSIDYLGKSGQDKYKIKVHCSKGTYIRTLVEDIGKQLGCPATLADLRRSTAGVFDLAGAYTLEQIQQAKNENTLDTLLRPIEDVFVQIPTLTLGAEETKRLQNGAAVYGKQGKPGRYRIYSASGFMGLACITEESILRGEKLFYGNETID